MSGEKLLEDVVFMPGLCVSVFLWVSICSQIMLICITERLSTAL